MHQYFRSIGFSHLVREQDIDRLLRSCEKHGMDSARRYIDSNEQMWLEIRVPVSGSMGLCITGYIGARGKFKRTAYYPYLRSEDMTSSVRPSVYRRVDGGHFSAIIDDARVGMTLIYQLDNPFDYLHRCGEGNPIPCNVISKLSGFCSKGFVLLPSAKADELRVRMPGDGQTQGSAGAVGSCGGGDGSDMRSAGAAGPNDGVDGQTQGSAGAASTGTPGQNAGVGQNCQPGMNNGAGLNGLPGQNVGFGMNPLPGQNVPNTYNGNQPGPNGKDGQNNQSDQEARMSLLEAARNGQTDAIEQLALEEMNTIATLSKRLQNEDIYSIVSSVFMPQGVECEIYLVVGDILKVERIRNEITGEMIYDLTLSANDMIIHVAINEADLEGEPMPGRRFKGRIWLQGRIEF